MHTAHGTRTATWLVPGLSGPPGGRPAGAVRLVHLPSKAWAAPMSDLGSLFAVGASTGGSFSNLEIVSGGRISFINAQGAQACLSYGAGLHQLVSLSPRSPSLPFAVESASQHVGFVEVRSCGGAHIARSRAGGVYCWGVLAEGQRGNFRGPARSGGAEEAAGEEPTLVSRLDCGVVSVGAGRGHFAAVTREGFGYAWGADDRGQLGLAPTSSKGRHLQVFGDLRTPSAPQRTGAGEYCGVPRAVSCLSHVPLRAVACGEDWTLFVSRAGEVYACGEGGCGQLGVGRVSSLLNPVRVSLEEAAGGQGSGSGGDIDTRCEELALGKAHVLLRTASGHVFTWGLNASGQLGLGDTLTRFRPQLLRESSRAPSAAPQHAAEPGVELLSSEGIGEEEDADGSMALSTARLLAAQAMLPVLASQVAAGSAHSVLLTVDGRVLSYGCSEGGRLGHSFVLAPEADTVAAPLPPAPLPPAPLLPPSGRAGARWAFCTQGLGPTSAPRGTYAPYRDPVHMDRNASVRAGLPAPAAALRNALGRVPQGVAEAGTWGIAAERTPSHSAMRAAGVEWQERRGAGRGASEDLGPAALAERTLVQENGRSAAAARCARLESLGMPWLRTPRPRVTHAPCLLPKEIQHPLFKTRRVTRIACGPADTFLFSRECARARACILLLCVCYLSASLHSLNSMASLFIRFTRNAPPPPPPLSPCSVQP